MEGPPASTKRTQVWAIANGAGRVREDALATEEPLEIRLRQGDRESRVVVTMRTPGADFVLSAGFLFSEGIVNSREDIVKIAYCADAVVTPEQSYNVVSVTVRAGLEVDLAVRAFAMSSACGVCGKESLEAIERKGVVPVGAGPVVSTALLESLPERLQAAQGVFARTGGLHAAGLFDADGGLITVQEDVGRHNAVDKVIGWALLEGRLPLRDSVMLVSGRSSFEIVQKCVAAGVPVLCSVSAPSSLAVDLARRFGMTLVGFLRGDRANVYSGRERIVPSPTERS